MKLYIEQIPLEGARLEETVSPQALELDTDIIKFKQPVKLLADVAMITNAVSVDLTLSTVVTLVCSRCLKEFEIDFRKTLKLNYPVEKSVRVIDLDQDIRQEIVLDYPMKPLCSIDCNGLCPQCGKNLNEGSCGCG